MEDHGDLLALSLRDDLKFLEMLVDGPLNQSIKPVRNGKSNKRKKLTQEKMFMKLIIKPQLKYGS